MLRSLDARVVGPLALVPGHRSVLVADVLTREANAERPALGLGTQAGDNNRGMIGAALRTIGPRDAVGRRRQRSDADARVPKARRHTCRTDPNFNRG